MTDTQRNAYPPQVASTALRAVDPGVHPRHEPRATETGLQAEAPVSLFDVDWSTPLHRPTDPGTSAAAAASLQELPERRRAVWKVLAFAGPMTDEQIAEVYARRVADGVALPQSPSGLRTRRAELVRAGLVVDTGRRAETSTGRGAVLWAAVEEVTG